MIKSVTIINDLGDSVTMTLGEVEPYSGLLITEIEGLGPVKADVNMTKMATQHGQKFNSVRANGRNIVLHVLFTYAETIEDVRQSTYKYFPLSRKITFHIETDNRIVEAYGYVESNDPDIFSDMESATISIVCESPWMADVSAYGYQTLNFSDINNKFEFIWSNESVTQPLTEFSVVDEKGEKLIHYDGETEAGCIISIYAYGTFTYPTIYYNITHEYYKIDTSQIEKMIGSIITPGDEIKISTVTNDKWAKFIRHGKEYNILNAIDINSTWFQVRPGDNVFSYTCESGNLDIVIELQTQILYQGV